MAGSVPYARGRERVVRICDAAVDARAFRARVLDEIRRAVGFDAYVWLLTDPETTVGTSPLADVPFLSELPTLIRLKYLTDVNRWTGLGGDGVARLQDTVGGEPSKSLLWREFLGPHEIGDVASAVFVEPTGCWGFLDLWRAGSTARFTDPEARFLRSLLVPVTAALRRCQAASFLEQSSTARPPYGPVVLLLSPELDVLAQTAEAQAYLRLLIPTEGEQSPIPAAAYNVAAQLLAVEVGVDANPPSARVCLSAGRWVTLRAARIGTEEPPEHRNIAVTIETSSPADRVGLFVRAFALSPRETELLGHLVAGADTRELARRMYLSEHTVQDHLKSIFDKTGTRNRRTLVSCAVGS